MEHISPLKETSSHPLQFEPMPHHGDHRFMETPVMAAAETMLFITNACCPMNTVTDPVCMTDAVFLKFIPIAEITPKPESGRTVSFTIEITPQPDQSLQVALVALTHSRKLGLTRSKTHLELSLTHHKIPENARPSGSPKKALCEVSADRIYNDLIRFGPAFQNLHKKLRIGQRRIDGVVWSGGKAIVNRLPDVLGSPFPFDAAMQAACVWGQFFQGIVAFPEGFAQRIIYQKTRPETHYRIRLALRKADADQFLCDGWIMTSEGAVCEAFYGLSMRDLSRGRLKVPSWVERLNPKKPENQ